MSEQLHPTGAVFISYASEDAEAAARICEALRAVGIEVWFDRSELRGGDAWDSQIKKEIHDCALFMPLISVHTNERIEGYFRGEWTLATRRLVNRAHDAAFLVPVVVDGTREADARVPEEFFRAQWTWLPAGETPPAFTRRVRQLLGLDPASAPACAAVTGTFEPRARTAGSVRPRRTALARSFGLSLTALLLVLGGGAFWYFQGTSDPPTAKPELATVAPVVPIAPNDKSIAVLPFADMSPGKDQEYMSDGIAEELLNLLAQVPDLKVIARTSSFAFKGQNIEVSEIAKRLNVAHVLEGSVRTSGNRLRITAQLVRTADSTHLWSERYDRPMDDIFAVQDEIAGAVVEQLKIKLLSAVPKVRKANPDAYALYLQALQLGRQYSHAGMEQSISLYQQALAIDPTYTAAWNGLAVGYSDQAYLGRGPRSAEEGFGLARETVNKALAIDRHYAPAHALLAWIAMVYDHDLMAAARHLKRALLDDAAGPFVIGVASELASNLGYRNTAMKLQEYVAARDPVNAGGHGGLAYLHYMAGRWADAIVSARSELTLAPDAIGSHYRIGVSLLLKGDAQAALREMQAEPDEGWRLTGLALVYHALGKKAESNASLADLVRKHEKSWSSSAAWVLAFRGETDEAFNRMDKAVAFRDTGVVHFHLEPLLSNLRDDPRWLPFLRKVGLAPEQLAAIEFEVKVPQ
jgi:TolB-like protein/tetratricopeptide (TPR) repeat protein